ILEYCEPDKCLIREKHYLDILKPEYNIAKDPTAPMSGRTHSEKSKQIMSDTDKKNVNPGRFKTGNQPANKGQNLSEKTKTKISDAKKGKPRPEGSGKPSQQIEVTDMASPTNNTTTSYNSISEAAIA